MLRLRPPALLALGLLALLVARVSPGLAQTRFDQTGWDSLLKAHVVNGLVDYDGFGRSAEFAGYLDRLAAFDPRSLPELERLAFWINAYNAYTIRLIVEHGQRKSIRNINKSLGFIKGYGPWKEKLARVGGMAYGLDEIEQGIIRPQFHEPRIHFALVCAAIGCPPLRSEAYAGARLDRQLEDQGRIFLRESPAKNRVNVAQRTVYVSELFNFRDYAKDFGGSKKAIAGFIARWYGPGPERSLLESGSWDRWVYTDYDWTLNSQKQGHQAAASGQAR